MLLLLLLVRVHILLTARDSDQIRAGLLHAPVAQCLVGMGDQSDPRLELAPWPYTGFFPSPEALIACLEGHIAAHSPVAPWRPQHAAHQGVSLNGIEASGSRTGGAAQQNRAAGHVMQQGCQMAQLAGGPTGA